jgi:hypothetical protein
MELDDKGRPKIPARYLDWLLHDLQRDPMHITFLPRSSAVKLSPEILSLLENDEVPEKA